MSIKHKLTLMTLGISAVTVILTVSALLMYLAHDVRTNRIKALAMNAAIAGDRNNAAIAFGYKDQVERNLEIYRLTPSIKAVCVYDASGNLFASFGFMSNAICTASYLNVPKSAEGLLLAHADMHYNAQVSGHVYIASDTSEIDSYILNIAKIGMAAIGIALCATLLPALYFSKAISRPVLELTSTAQAIARDGNYALQANARYPDEIGNLARVFNEMLQEVRKRDEKLALANEALEEKVMHRTRELEDAKNRAEAANEIKSEFLRNMSHEFRTPLHAILSFSAYGLKEYKSAKRERLFQYFTHIKKGSERLGNLVNGVLDLAKMENGSQSFAMEYTDLRTLSTRAYELIYPLAQNKNLGVYMEHAGEEVGVLCDPDKLTQVITNLLSNAIKFTPAGKAITVRTRIIADGDERMSELSVIDEGVGIPPAEKETIFESFRQSSRTNQGAGGTGLGLAISRGIITAHHGRIWAENNSSGGACITFSLPAARKDFTYYPMQTTNEMTYGRT